MAVGDAVVNMRNYVSTSSKYTFQPASGVTVCITFLAGSYNGYIFWEAVNSSGFFKTTIATSDSVGGQAGLTNMKLFINNSEYIRFGTTNNSFNAVAYSGIQTA